MDAAGRHEYPEDPRDLSKLALLLGYPSTEKLSTEVTKMFRNVRKTFLQVFTPAEQA